MLKLLFCPGIILKTGRFGKGGVFVLRLAVKLIAKWSQSWLQNWLQNLTSYYVKNC